MSYIGAQPSTASFPFDQFSGNGATTAFTMSYAPASTTSMVVCISGVVQNPNTYNISGLTLTFTQAPPTGTNNIAILYLGLPVQVGVPSTGTVGIAQLSATGTPSSTTFLRGDNTWGAPIAGTGPAFSAYANTIQTISAATVTKIQFNTERFDTNSAYDNATNYRFQPLVAGYYQINLGVTFNNNVTGDGSYTLLYKNGSCIAVSGAGATGSTYSAPNVASVVYLNGSTDYVEGYVFIQNGPKNTVVNLFGTGDGCVFSGALIRGA